MPSVVFIQHIQRLYAFFKRNGGREMPEGCCQIELIDDDDVSNWFLQFVYKDEAGEDFYVSLRMLFTEEDQQQQKQPKSSPSMSRSLAGARGSAEDDSLPSATATALPSASKANEGTKAIATSEATAASAQSASTAGDDMASTTAAVAAEAAASLRRSKDPSEVDDSGKDKDDGVDHRSATTHDTDTTTIKSDDKSSNDGASSNAPVTRRIVLSRMPLVFVISPRLVASFIHYGAICSLELMSQHWEQTPTSVALLISSLYHTLNPFSGDGKVSIDDAGRAANRRAAVVAAGGVIMPARGPNEGDNGADPLQNADVSGGISAYTEDEHLSGMERIRRAHPHLFRSYVEQHTQQQQQQQQAVAVPPLDRDRSSMMMMRSSVQGNSCSRSSTTTSSSGSRSRSEESSDAESEEVQEEEELSSAQGSNRNSDTENVPTSLAFSPQTRLSTVPGIVSPAQRKVAHHEGRGKRMKKKLKAHDGSPRSDREETEKENDCVTLFPTGDTPPTVECVSSPSFQCSSVSLSSPLAAALGDDCERKVGEAGRSESSAKLKTRKSKKTPQAHPHHRRRHHDPAHAASAEPPVQNFLTPCAVQTIIHDAVLQRKSRVKARLSTRTLLLASRRQSNVKAEITRSSPLTCEPPAQEGASLMAAAAASPFGVNEEKREDFIRVFCATGAERGSKARGKSQHGQEESDSDDVESSNRSSSSKESCNRDGSMNNNNSSNSKKNNNNNDSCRSASEMKKKYKERGAEGLLPSGNGGDVQEPTMGLPPLSAAATRQRAAPHYHQKVIELWVPPTFVRPAARAASSPQLRVAAADTPMEEEIDGNVVPLSTTEASTAPSISAHGTTTTVSSLSVRISGSDDADLQALRRHHKQQQQQGRGSTRLPDVLVPGIALVLRSVPLPPLQLEAITTDTTSAAAAAGCKESHPHDMPQPLSQESYSSSSLTTTTTRQGPYDPILPCTVPSSLSLHLEHLYIYGHLRVLGRVTLRHCVFVGTITTEGNATVTLQGCSFAVCAEDRLFKPRLAPPITFPGLYMSVESNKSSSSEGPVQHDAINGDGRLEAEGHQQQQEQEQLPGAPAPFGMSSRKEGILVLDTSTVEVSEDSCVFHLPTPWEPLVTLTSSEEEENAEEEHEEEARKEKGNGSTNQNLDTLQSSSFEAGQEGEKEVSTTTSIGSATTTGEVDKQREHSIDDVSNDAETHVEQCARRQRKRKAKKKRRSGERHAAVPPPPPQPAAMGLHMLRSIILVSNQGKLKVSGSILDPRLGADRSVFAEQDATVDIADSLVIAGWSSAVSIQGCRAYVEDTLFVGVCPPVMYAGTAGAVASATAVAAEHEEGNKQDRQNRSRLVAVDGAANDEEEEKKKMEQQKCKRSAEDDEDDDILDSIPQPPFLQVDDIHRSTGLNVELGGIISVRRCTALHLYFGFSVIAHSVAHFYACSTSNVVNGFTVDASTATLENCSARTNHVGVFLLQQAKCVVMEDRGGTLASRAAVFAEAWTAAEDIVASEAAVAPLVPSAKQIDGVKVADKDNKTTKAGASLLSEGAPPLKHDLPQVVSVAEAAANAYDGGNFNNNKKNNLDGREAGEANCVDIGDASGGGDGDSVQSTKSNGAARDMSEAYSLGQPPPSSPSSAVFQTRNNTSIDAANASDTAVSSHVNNLSTSAAAAATSAEQQLHLRIRLITEQIFHTRMAALVRSEEEEASSALQGLLQPGTAAVDAVQADGKKACASSSSPSWTRKTHSRSQRKAVGQKNMTVAIAAAIIVSAEQQAERTFPSDRAAEEYLGRCSYRHNYRRKQQASRSPTQLSHWGFYTGGRFSIEVRSSTLKASGLTLLKAEDTSLYVYDGGIAEAADCLLWTPMPSRRELQTCGVKAVYARVKAVRCLTIDYAFSFAAIQLAQGNFEDCMAVRGVNGFTVDRSQCTMKYCGTDTEHVGVFVLNHSTAELTGTDHLVGTSASARTQPKIICGGFPSVFRGKVYGVESQSSTVHCRGITVLRGSVSGFIAYKKSTLIIEKCLVDMALQDAGTFLFKAKAATAADSAVGGGGGTGEESTSVASPGLEEVRASLHRVSFLGKKSTDAEHEEDEEAAANTIITVPLSSSVKEQQQQLLQAQYAASMARVACLSTNYGTVVASGALDGSTGIEAATLATRGLLAATAAGAVEFEPKPKSSGVKVWSGSTCCIMNCEVRCVTFGFAAIGPDTELEAHHCTAKHVVNGFTVDGASMCLTKCSANSNHVGVFVLSNGRCTVRRGSYAAKKFGIESRSGVIRIEGHVKLHGFSRIGMYLYSGALLETEVGSLIDIKMSKRYRAAAAVSVAPVSPPPPPSSGSAMAAGSMSAISSSARHFFPVCLALDDATAHIHQAELGGGATCGISCAEGAQALLHMCRVCDCAAVGVNVLRGARVLMVNCSIMCRGVYAVVVHAGGIYRAEGASADATAILEEAATAAVAAKAIEQQRQQQQQPKEKEEEDEQGDSAAAAAVTDITGSDGRWRGYISQRLGWKLGDDDSAQGGADEARSPGEVGKKDEVLPPHSEEGPCPLHIATTVGSLARPLSSPVVSGGSSAGHHSGAQATEGEGPGIHFAKVISGFFGGRKSSSNQGSGGNCHDSANGRAWTRSMLLALRPWQYKLHYRVDTLSGGAAIATTASRNGSAEGKETFATTATIERAAAAATLTIAAAAATGLPIPVCAMIEGAFCIAGSCSVERVLVKGAAVNFETLQAAATTTTTTTTTTTATATTRTTASSDGVETNSRSAAAASPAQPQAAVFTVTSQATHYHLLLRSRGAVLHAGLAVRSHLDLGEVHPPSSTKSNHGSDASSGEEENEEDGNGSDGDAEDVRQEAILVQGTGNLHLSQCAFEVPVPSLTSSSSSSSFTSVAIRCTGAGAFLRMEYILVLAPQPQAEALLGNQGLDEYGLPLVANRQAAAQQQGELTEKEEEMAHERLIAEAMKKLDLVDTIPPPASGINTSKPQWTTTTTTTATLKQERGTEAAHASALSNDPPRVAKCILVSLDRHARADLRDVGGMEGETAYWALSSVLEGHVDKREVGEQDEEEEVTTLADAAGNEDGGRSLSGHELSIAPAATIALTGTQSRSSATLQPRGAQQQQHVRTASLFLRIAHHSSLTADQCDMASISISGHSQACISRGRLSGPACLLAVRGDSKVHLFNSVVSGSLQSSRRVFLPSASAASSPLRTTHKGDDTDNSTAMPPSVVLAVDSDIAFHGSRVYALNVATPVLSACRSHVKLLSSYLSHPTSLTGALSSGCPTATASSPSSPCVVLRASALEVSCAVHGGEAAAVGEDKTGGGALWVREALGTVAADVASSVTTISAPPEEGRSIFSRWLWGRKK